MFNLSGLKVPSLSRMTGRFWALFRWRSRLEARIFVIEVATVESSNRISRKMEERAKLAEASAKAFATTAFDRLVRSLDERAECANREMARNGEARAQAAETNAKAYADAGLITLAQNMSAAHRVVQRTAKRLEDAFDSIREQKSNQQDIVELVNELRNCFARLDALEAMVADSYEHSSNRRNPGQKLELVQVEFKA